MGGSNTISTGASPLMVKHSPPPSSSYTPSSKNSSTASLRSTSSTAALASQPGSDELAVEQLLNRLTVSDSITTEKNKSMFSTLETIFQQADAREVGINVDLNQLHAIFERADQSDQQGYKDVQALGSVRGILDQMWWHGSEAISAAATVLADGSRDPAWREPFGEAGILDFFIGVVFTNNIQHNLLLHTLRLIGNTCADTNINRQRVVAQDALPHIIRCLRDISLIDVAVPVLFNICIDFEPAQQVATANFLCPALVDLLGNLPTVGSPLLSYICRLFDFAMEQFDTNLCPDYTVEVILRAASDSDTDLDDRTSLVNAAVTHLKHERFQRLLLTKNLLEVPLALIARSYSAQLSSNAPLSVTNLTLTAHNPEEEIQLTAMRGLLIQSLSDISALPEFGASFPLDSPLISSLVAWLLVPQVQLQTCACIILGNLARSDAVCQEMVQDRDIHKPLIAKLRQSTDTQVLHSTMGFLRNLALPSENKDDLGEAEIIPAVSRFWDGTVPQLRFGAVSLTRQVINGSLTNIERLLASLSPDPESPAHERTYLSLLLLLFEKSDDVSTNVEIARIVAAICRGLNSAGVASDPESQREILHRFYNFHPNVARPLSMMVSQSRWPVIRSEGWFGLALMARSREGSAAVSDVLQQVEVFGPLVETIMGRVTPEDEGEGSEEETDSEQQKSMKAKDRDNARVLVSELLKNRGEDMYVPRRGVFENLLRGRKSSVSLQDLFVRARSPSAGEEQRPEDEDGDEESDEDEEDEDDE